MDDREKLLDEIRELALQAAKEGREASAVEFLHGYIKHRTQDGFAWFTFGDALRIIGLKDEAERVLLQAIELCKPERHGWIFSRLARLHNDAGRYAQAEDFYRRTCEDAEFRAYGSMWILRGANLAAATQLAAAEKCHRHALTFHDEHVDRDEAYLNLGYVLRAQGRYAEAREALGQALEITPDYTDAKEALDSLAGVEEAISKAKQLEDTVS